MTSRRCTTFWYKSCKEKIITINKMIKYYAHIKDSNIRKHPSAIRIYILLLFMLLDIKQRKQLPERPNPTNKNQKHLQCWSGATRSGFRTGFVVLCLWNNHAMCTTSLGVDTLTYQHVSSGSTILCLFVLFCCCLFFLLFVVVVVVVVVVLSSHCSPVLALSAKQT